MVLKGNQRKEGERKLGALAEQQAQEGVLAAALTIAIINNSSEGLGSKQKDVKAMDM